MLTILSHKLVKISKHITQSLRTCINSRGDHYDDKTKKSSKKNKKALNFPKIFKFFVYLTLRFENIDSSKRFQSKILFRIINAY